MWWVCLFLCVACWGSGVLVGMGEDGRLVWGVVVRRLLVVVEGLGSVSLLYVWVMGVAAGVSVRTVWRWLSEVGGGRLEPAAGQGRFVMDDG